MNSKYILFHLLVLFVSGIFGALTGSVTSQLGLDHATSCAFAGLIGFMAAQTFNLVCLLFSTRYQKVLGNVNK
jgi:hypothetical protein